MSLPAPVSCSNFRSLQISEAFVGQQELEQHL